MLKMSKFFMFFAMLFFFFGCSKSNLPTYATDELSSQIEELNFQVKLPTKLPSDSSVSSSTISSFAEQDMLTIDFHIEEKASPLTLTITKSSLLYGGYLEKEDVKIGGVDGEYIRYEDEDILWWLDKDISYSLKTPNKNNSFTKEELIEIAVSFK